VPEGRERAGFTRLRFSNWSRIRQRVTVSSQPLNESFAGSYVKPGIFFATEMSVSCTTSSASVSFKPARRATLKMSSRYVR
jgi:hypothetical protein